jgi:4-amino-4-deoxy-L-arabinose transferase-like glycosyltransferase
LTTDVLQPLTWLGCSWCVVRLAQTGDERWWLGFGAIVGVSLLSKYLIAFYLLGMAVGVIATPLRRSLLKPWIYLGAAIALGMAAPSIVWQSQHDWPFIELGKAGMNGKNLALSPLEFLGEQVLFAGPLTLPVWLAGLWRFSVRPPLPATRAFAIAYFVAAVLFYVLHGKAYYLTPIYPTVFAGGGLALEAWLRPRALRAAVLAVVAIGGAALSPFAIPILPVDAYIRYAAALGLTQPALERGSLGVLPQQYADMFGWREMAARVAAVYQALPPADRARAVFFGRNYGEAAAIDIYGPALGLPPAISAHNNYYLWGLRGHDGSVLIVAGGDPAEMAKAYGSIEVAGRIDTPYAMPYETNLPIYVLRDPKVSLAPLWPTLKHYE